MNVFAERLNRHGMVPGLGVGFATKSKMESNVLTKLKQAKQNFESIKDKLQRHLTPGQQDALTPAELQLIEKALGSDYVWRSVKTILKNEGGSQAIAWSKNIGPDYGNFIVLSKEPLFGINKSHFEGEFAYLFGTSFGGITGFNIPSILGIDNELLISCKKFGYGDSVYSAVTSAKAGDIISEMANSFYLANLGKLGMKKDLDLGIFEKYLKRSKTSIVARLDSANVMHNLTIYQYFSRLIDHIERVYVNLDKVGIKQPELYIYMTDVCWHRGEKYLNESFKLLEVDGIATADIMDRFSGILHHPSFKYRLSNIFGGNNA